MEFTAVVTHANDGQYNAWCAEAGAGVRGQDLDEVLRRLRTAVARTFEGVSPAAVPHAIVRRIEVDLGAPGTDAEPGGAEEPAAGKRVEAPGPALSTKAAASRVEKGASQTTLTHEQRLALADLLSRAFLSLRAPGYGCFWNGKEGHQHPRQLPAAVDRAVAYGEELHNVPLYMFAEVFDFDLQINAARHYAQLVPELDRRVQALERMRDLPAAHPRS